MGQVLNGHIRCSRDAAKMHKRLRFKFLPSRRYEALS